jgi:hypothetical protein
MKNLFDSLNWYRGGQIGAEAAAAATGVPEPSQRLLQKLGVNTPVSQAATNSKRMLGPTAFKRLACIGPLYSSGLSIALSGKIVYSDTHLENVLFHTFDPLEAFFEREAHSAFGFPTLRSDPKPWFDPARALQSDDQDRYLDILNNKYVRSTAATDGPGIIGEISADRSEVVIWFGAEYCSWFGADAFEPLFDNEGDRLIRDPVQPNYSSKRPTSADLKSAERAWCNPTSKLSINVGLALRAALRRLLGIDGPSNP